jgi:ABC-type uncharacterized transport system ATPase subunit
MRGARGWTACASYARGVRGVCAAAVILAHMTSPPFLIEAEGLVKSYGNTAALAGLDVVVPAGRVLGLLGPNGAGKPNIGF